MDCSLPRHSVQPDYHLLISETAHIATHVDALLKTSKILYRLFDIATVARGALAAPWMMFNAHVKNFVFTIESTSFFPTFYLLVFPDEKGHYFFCENTRVRMAERVSITVHTALKMVYGADVTRLISLGKIGAFALGRLTLFRYAIEATILSYYLFGHWDAWRILAAAKQRIGLSTCKIGRWQERRSLENNSTIDAQKITSKISAWTCFKEKGKFERNKARLKILFTALKMTLVTTATLLTALNITAAPAYLYILGLGLLSDAIGLGTIFYVEVRKKN